MLKWSNVAVIAGLLLGVGGLLSSDNTIVVGCLVLAAALLLGSLWYHKELGWVKRLLLAVVIIGVDAGFIARTQSKDLAAELKQKEGALVPANVATPATGCRVPRLAVALLLGPITSWTDIFPHTVVQIHNQRVLSIDEENGSLLVSFKVFDDRGDLVAKLDRNHFITTNSAAYIRRPDTSTLQVFDHNDLKVLDIRFLNRLAIKVTGIFRVPTAAPLIVQDDGVLIGHASLGHACSGDSGRIDFKF